MDVGRGTLCTLERFFPKVFLHVEIQQLLASECVGTKMAFEGSFCAFDVNNLMILPEMLFLEPFATFVALEVIARQGVVLYVGNVVGFQRERLWTHVALVRPDVGVALLVIQKYLLFLESFSAVGALVSVSPIRSALMLG